VLDNVIGRAGVGGGRRSFGYLADQTNRQEIKNGFMIY